MTSDRLSTLTTPTPYAHISCPVPSRERRCAWMTPLPLSSMAPKRQSLGPHHEPHDLKTRNSSSL
ncbi:hypothetical protein E2C01_067247 [Portunus trituberculatus]|uniref:Uncharacterized protein n=1 Tax=Portunus trituberculatus TaxID=210409 RepID=A0A5B7HS47_PORTR|nr:hypothetical protein [Portunus trituberculatus]